MLSFGGAEVLKTLTVITDVCGSSRIEQETITQSIGGLTSWLWAEYGPSLVGAADIEAANAPIGLLQMVTSLSDALSSSDSRANAGDNATKVSILA